MARPLRIEYEGAFYHVTARGNERKRIYDSTPDYEKFRSYLKRAQEKYGYVLHCYVLMTNHYHLLIETPQANLGRVMHYINGSYANYFNIKKRRSGHFFQGRYKGILIDKDSYLLELSRYLHLNPVRAKMVKRPQDYPYSSYGSYIGQEKEDIVYRDLILGMMGKDQRRAKGRYKDFVNRGIGSKLANPLKGVYGGMILGGKRFIKEMLRRLDEGSLAKKEFSYKRSFVSSVFAEDIQEFLSSSLEQSWEEIVKGKNKGHRNLAIYLFKQHTGLTNKQMGSICGEMSYSAVSKAYHRFKENLEQDTVLKKEVEEVMSNVKG